MTGGGRGIGLACAKGLIEAGCDVGIFDVIESTADLPALEKEFDVKIKHYMYVTFFFLFFLSCSTITYFFY